MSTSYLRSICILGIVSAFAGCRSGDQNISPPGCRPGPPEVPYRHISAGGSLRGGNAKIADATDAVFERALSSRDDRQMVAAIQSLALCHHPAAVRVIGRGLTHESPFIQLASIRALSLFQSDASAEALRHSLRSDYPIVRLEAVWSLIQARAAGALDQVRAIHEKLPREFFIFLPELYAKEGSPAAVFQLQKLFYEEPDPVVCQVLLSIYKYQILDCEPFIVSYRSHSAPVLECVAAACELFPSEASLDRLRELSSHQAPAVRARALASRASLGDSSCMGAIKIECESGNAAIIPALVSSRRGVEFFSSLSAEAAEGVEGDLSRVQYAVVANQPGAAALVQSLVSAANRASTKSVYMPSFSPGGSIVLWTQRAEPAHLGPHDLLYAQEQSLEVEEGLLTLSAQYMSQKDLAAILGSIAEHNRVDLYPIFCSLLQGLPRDRFDELYARFCHAPGSPYLRAYLALAKMMRDREYKKDLMESCFSAARSGLAAADARADAAAFRVSLPFAVNALPEVFRCNEENIPLEASAKLYLLCCQASVDLAGRDDAVNLMVEELEKAPPHMAPFIAAALVEATL